MRGPIGGKRNGKVIGQVRKPKPSPQDNQWVLKLLDDPSLAADLNYSRDQLVTKTRGKSLCVACKGGKFLCGKTRCPLVVRFSSYFKSVPLLQGTVLDGACPPGVFVGRIGYPYVYAGPLVPPIHEDTSHYDLPESWFGKSIDEIVGFRSLLVRGKHRVHVKKFEESGKIMDQTIDLALSVNPVDVELSLKKKPSAALVLDDQVQPFGPSALLKKMQISNSRWDHHIQKAYFDDDLKASEAVTTLFQKGTLVTKIQRAFSVGAFGMKEQRRLVPTRWSITAVDSIISKDMMNKIRTFPEINEYRVYESRYLDNRFEVLMMPREWSYEAMEAWYPGTVWNPSSRNIVLFSDWEGFGGRSTYASIGGCYYAARLAVGELLMKERRQALVVVLREAHPGYIMPVGVWQVREHPADYGRTCHKSTILNYVLYLKKKGKAESTQKTILDRFTRLDKKIDITDPEQLKEYLSNVNWQNNTKKSMIIYFTGFYKYLGIKWEKPTYKENTKLPFIPTEDELNSLISASPKRLATLLQLLKETGARIGEAHQLKWSDLDLERRTAHITPEKYSNPRIAPLSHKLINMLNKLPRKNDYVFYRKYNTIRERFRYNRNKTVKKLQNPRLKKIHFHTFRHFKGTTEYHKTKDIIHVKTVLGHKSIKSTMKYINIEASIFKYSNDEFNTATAKTPKEAQKLIESGFTKADEFDGIHIYKKRK